MKKWLSILGAIGLTAINTTSLLACEKSEKKNNENGGESNKPKPTPEPQQPSKGSNWKLVNDYNYFENNIDHKWYFLILKK